MLKKIFYYPSKNLVIVIPIVLVIGFIAGLNMNFSFLKNYILIFTFFMIYPTMVGFKIKEAVDLSHIKVVIYTSILNFIFIPLFAFFLGKYY